MLERQKRLPALAALIDGKASRPKAQTPAEMWAVAQQWAAAAPAKPRNP